jgi:hypothetical protein
MHAQKWAIPVDAMHHANEPPACLAISPEHKVAELELKYVGHLARGIQYEPGIQWRCAA